MNGLRKSVDSRDSNKRLEVSAPYDPVHVQRVGFDSITGNHTISHGKRQEFFQDNCISKRDQENDSLATIESSHGDDGEIARYDALKTPRLPPRIPGLTPTSSPEVSKPVDDRLTSTGLRVPRFPRPLSDSSKLLSLPLPKKGHSRAHSSSVSGSYAISTTHPPASYRPFPPPSPAQPNLDLSNPQQVLPKSPRNDKPAYGNATGDRRTLEPQVSVKATASTSPVTERLVQPTMAPQQQSAVANLRGDAKKRKKTRQMMQI